MGILEGMVSGAGEALQNVGLQGVAAAIQAERDARLSELRLSEEATIRQRGKDDAAAERARVETEAKRNAEQRGGLIAERQGLDDPEYRGDENPGYNVQKGQAAPTSRDYMKAQGKYTEIANLEEKDADNLRDAARRKSEDEKWRTQFAETVRHNKTLESSANYGRIPPAAKAQLEMASTAVMSAHKAEAEAAKALEAGRKDTLASPEKIRQLEDEYKSSKSAVVSALKQYDQIGAAHFGEQWKKTEIEAPAAPPAGTQEVRVGGKVIGHASTKAEADALVAKYKRGGTKADTGIIGTPGSGSSPRANIYGTQEAKQRRIDELERIIGDNGNPRDVRKDAEQELATLRTNQ